MERMIIINNFKRLIKLFVYVLVIGLVAGWGEYHLVSLRQEIKTTFNPYPLAVFSTLYPVFIGISIGIPKLLNELKKEGGWKWDWVKLIAIGLPTAYISCFLVSVYTPLGTYLYPEVFDVLLSNSRFMVTLSGVALGILLVNVPCKRTLD